MDLMSRQKEKSKYVKSTRYILVNEFCERFTYFGLKTVLILYLTSILKFNGDESTIIYHSFIFLSYFVPLPCAILGDSYWGKFKTIICLSSIYVVGCIVLTGASIANMFSLDVQNKTDVCPIPSCKINSLLIGISKSSHLKTLFRILAFLGLFSISVGTGGVKPCNFAFGGDQFQLPQQEKHLQHFATMFTLAVYTGSLISTFLMPELRHSIHCFGRDTCFPLAFGVPTIMMFIGIVIFVAGKNTYVKKKPENNVLTRTFGCIFYALRAKFTSSVPCKTHWLDNAKGKYTESEISDTRSVLSVICVFTAYPVFWSLYEQPGSRWTLQAMLMNGRVDFLNWTIKPDQIQMLVPLFGVIVLVLFDVVLYPMFAAIGLRKPLQKLTFCGVLAVIAFVFAAILQFKIVGNTTQIPSGQGQLYIYNGFDCQVFVESKSLQLQNQIGPLEMFNVSHAIVSQNSSEDVMVVGITLRFGSKCNFVLDNYEFTTDVTIIEGKGINVEPKVYYIGTNLELKYSTPLFNVSADYKTGFAWILRYTMNILELILFINGQPLEISYHLARLNSNTIALNRIGIHDNLVKEKFGNPNLRVLVDHTFDVDDNITLTCADHNSFISYSLSEFRGMNFTAIKVGKYNVFYNGKMLPTSTMDIIPATFYTLTLQRNGDKMDVRLFTKDEGNYIHILWQLPQYVCMSIANIIFMVTIIKFAFTEAPKSMKSSIAAISLSTMALGNLLVVIISTISFKNLAHEFLLYSGLMLADTLLLGYFSVVYRSKNTDKTDAMSSNKHKMEETSVVK